MPEPARIDVSEAEIEAAIRDARLFERFDRRVELASYSEGTDSIVLHLQNGVTHRVPRKLLQGLANADSESLKDIELLGRGTGLYWPALDVTHSVTGLLAGVYLGKMDAAFGRRIPERPHLRLTFQCPTTTAPAFFGRFIKNGIGTSTTVTTTIIQITSTYASSRDCTIAIP